MKNIKTCVISKPLIVYLSFAFFLIASIPQNSWAYFVGPQPLNFSREADIDKIQRVLESKIVSQRLAELGLSMDAINSRLNELNNAEMHQFASQLESLMPGGDTIIAIMGLLVIVILVLVILQLTGHKVVVK
ncbi:MAG TPA: hypothetical protein DHU69_02520 [Deltaproteobacteria bacterium]|nr:MAG: hypothetical protein A2067_04500 [Deltaproteobacteria bacterium GWB2_42_7]OGP47121.1 MAG: hypothetical protein A2022_08295 [Deltaproteobacteria bacterium GWF2_42_12]OGQ26696.1 MAG: hypothetical protein A3D29_05435 [Deltaproteobacteria bacterium RIFCSPHIGHO2_02_FULL_42_44]OGQ38167.1 MAG: hypothetical protein A3H47_05715 [Deltaproteobacteria bacterium RIFCSPLOWO2_02_FULL_42_39]OGQ68999.1 MAG: hypothetical protein A3F88_09440 [Deltaproteobacteria bacterium RIFCSPLOWO2_12_FULL_42_16]OGQ754